SQNANDVYATYLLRLNAKPDAGTCPDTLPGEGPTAQGRLGCAEDASKTGAIAWTIDPSHTVSFAFGPTGMDAKGLHDWWSSANWQAPSSGGRTTSTTPTTTTTTTP